jgi:hypothetical protein
MVSIIDRHAAGQTCWFAPIKKTSLSANVAIEKSLPRNPTGARLSSFLIRANPCSIRALKNQSDFR